MITIGLLITIFLGALVSGWHCALMCGGISASIESWHKTRYISSKIAQKTQKRLIYEQLLMHLGRLTTYVGLGGLAGLIGFAAWRQQALPIQRVMFAVAAALLIVQGIRILRHSAIRLSAWERWLNERAAVIWSALHGRVANSSDLKARWLQGMVWGLVPCGLVYSVLPLAFLSGDAISGALLMGAFGLGTLPNLLLISGLSARLAQWGHQAWARYAVAGLMVGAGLLGLYRSWTLPEDLIRGGFCISETLNYNATQAG
jgi:sulfite exporter TauE/SafE